MSGRILIIKPSSFGDIVHLFPALALLKQILPDHKLDFVVNPEFIPLLEFSPFKVDRVIRFERRKLASFSGFLPQLCKLVRELRQEQYDYVIDFQGLFRSAFCAWVSRSPVKAGFACPREKTAKIFYNRKHLIPRSHAVERNVKLVEALLELPSNPVCEPELPVSAAGIANLPELPGRYIVLLPGTRWESKRFPPEFFAELIKKLRDLLPDTGFVVSGGANEAELGQKIGENVINLAGKTDFAELFELLRNSVAVIGNDSGPLHAAAALNKTVFGFYGPTDPALTGPWGSRSHAISADIPCKGCLQRVCPRDREPLCHKLDAGKIARQIADELNKGE